MPSALQQAGEVGLRAVGEEEGRLCKVGRMLCREEAEFEEGGGFRPSIGRQGERWGGSREGIGGAFGWGGGVVWKRNTVDVEEGDWGGGDPVGCKATRRAAMMDCSKG